MIPFPSQIIFVATSPSSHLLRSIFSTVFAAYFTVLAFKILRHVHTGVTLLVARKQPFFSLRVLPGKKKAPNGYWGSYNGRLSTAFLGLLFYTSAHLLLVMMFKRAFYSFTY